MIQDHITWTIEYNKFDNNTTGTSDIFWVTVEAPPPLVKPKELSICNGEFSYSTS